MEERSLKKKLILFFKSSDEITLHLIATIGGQLFEDIVVIFHRQSPAERSTTNGNGTNAERERLQGTTEMKDETGFKVYPNPAAGKINFQLPNNIPVQNLQLSVFDILGKKMKEVPVQSSNTGISLIGYKPGTYLYKIINKDQILYSGKFIVQ